MLPSWVSCSLRAPLRRLRPQLLQPPTLTYCVARYASQATSTGARPRTYSPVHAQFSRSPNVGANLTALLSKASVDAVADELSRLRDAKALTPAVVLLALEHMASQRGGPLSLTDRVDLGWRMLLHVLPAYPLELGNAPDGAASRSNESPQRGPSGKAGPVATERLLGAMAKLAGCARDPASLHRCLHTLLACGGWPSVFFLNDVITGLCACGDADAALALFEQLHEFGAAPHLDTYAALGGAVAAGRLPATR